MSRVDDLLRSYSEAKRDFPFDLRADGPAVFAEMLGGKPAHSSKLYRLATKGSRGVVLETVEDGSRALICTRRWIAEFAAAVSDARGQQAAKPRKKGAAHRQRRRAATKNTQPAKTGGTTR